MIEESPTDKSATDATDSYERSNCRQIKQISTFGGCLFALMIISITYDWQKIV